MIITKAKPFAEILQSLEAEKTVFLVGCAECATVASEVVELREELPDWLQPERELDADEYSGQSLKPVTPFELPTPVLTGQGV